MRSDYKWPWMEEISRIPKKYFILKLSSLQCLIRYIYILLDKMDSCEEPMCLRSPCATEEFKRGPTRNGYLTQVEQMILFIMDVKQEGKPLHVF